MSRDNSSPKVLSVRLSEGGAQALACTECQCLGCCQSHLLSHHAQRIETCLEVHRMPPLVPAASALGYSAIVLLRNPAREATLWGVWHTCSIAWRMCGDVKAWRVRMTTLHASQLLSGVVSYSAMGLYIMPDVTSMVCTSYLSSQDQTRWTDDGLEAQASAHSGSPCVAGKPSQSLQPAGRPPGPGSGQQRLPAARCWTALRSSGPEWPPPPLQRALELQGTPAATLQQ